jgi:hypothetical protein
MLRPSLYEFRLDLGFAFAGQSLVDFVPMFKPALIHLLTGNPVRSD